MGTKVYVLDSQRPKGYEIAPCLNRPFTFTVEGPRVNILEYIGALTADEAKALADALYIAAGLACEELDIEVAEGE